MSETYIFAPETLIKAYSLGVFPMALSHDSPEIHFFEPDERGIIPINPPHIPRRLLRLVKQRPYEIRYNTAFHEVITQCAAITETRDDSWINSTIIELYVALHAMGFAHSVEVWDGDRLVGGLYGVKLGRAFFGESMFSRVSNASKIALTHLMARLHYGGFTLLDAQFANDHLTQFGLIEISKEDFQERLSVAKEGRGDLCLDKDEDEMIAHLVKLVSAGQLPDAGE